ncbi:MAG TPA: 2-hydroxyacyl-CoA dehydratase [Chloroflexi bacterium]|nr:2-hydroxyacyl-CoA dehydratase [Chloroflexota bacterium]
MATDDFDIATTGHSGPRIGFLTAYVPEELFHAAGFTPVFIFPAPGDQGYARAHLPSFVCWVVTSALNQALSGQLDHLAGIAIAKTCDATQGLADVWPQCVPHIPLFHFGMPLRLESPAARIYLTTELKSLRQRLEALIGYAITDDDLRASLSHYDQHRLWMHRLYAEAAHLSPSDLYRWVQAANRMAKPTHSARVQAFLVRRESAGGGPAADAPRIILVGPVLGDAVLFEALAEAGACVVGDMFDLGEDYLAADTNAHQPLDEESDPWDALAARLLARLPTPTKYHPRRSRADHLLKRVAERAAEGVIFARQKFCEPHGFDYAALSRTLKQAHIPYLLIELEQASQAGQLRTRIEAFVELLAERRQQSDEV